MSPYASIDDLRSQLGGSPKSPEQQAAYAQRMLHAIPDAPVIHREQYIVEHSKGKRVLEFGASGLLTEAIRKVAADYLGVDREASDGIRAFDLDEIRSDASAAALLAGHPGVGPSLYFHTPDGEYKPDVIVCGEVLEHLSNPGWFLTRLKKKYAGVPTIITVPNAFSEVAQKHLVHGLENVNADHVCWYSFRTMTTLLKRAGYVDFSFAWYRGKPLIAEGLIFVCEAPL